MARRKKGKMKIRTKDDGDREAQEVNVPQQSSSLPHWQPPDLNGSIADLERMDKNLKGKAREESMPSQMQEGASAYNDRPTYQVDHPLDPLSNYSKVGPSGGFFEGTNGVKVNGGKFNQTYGHQTNVTIQFQSQREEEFNASQSQQPLPQPPTSGSQVTRPNTQESLSPSAHEHYFRQTQPLTMSAHEQDPPVSQTIYSPDSRKIYEQHLGLKKRGLPLWIPHLNRRSPLPYRRKGLSIGDVGIITPSGGFSFLFNICLPHDDPINPRVLPEGFTPIPMESIDIREVLEFNPESYLASTSIEKVHDDTSSRGLSFKTSAAEGAVLTLPEGAIAFDLENVARFRVYAAENIEKWYRYANGPRGREAKNGDVRLVIGCDKVTSWGIAAVANMSQKTTHYLKYHSLESGSTGSVSPIPLYKWEYSGMAEAKVGPELREIEELKRNDDSNVAVEGKYWNQSVFIRTLNPALSDEVFAAISQELEVPCIQDSQQHTGTNDSPSESPNSSSQTSNTTLQLDSNLGTRRGPSESSGSSMTTLLSPQSHPADVLNRLLLEKVPNCRTVITQDKDWFSVVNEDDKIMPSPSDIAERVLAANYIREDNGVIFLEPKEKILLTADRVLTPSNTPGLVAKRPKSSNPKSSRQQFSACGACRMRRVRCDLKELPISFVGPPPACTNCRERGIKCVDEFADVKAMKLLRRGRRIQQVEAIYGKAADQAGTSSPIPPKSSVNIPALQPEFFDSPFWRWFSIQRPILDVDEFPAQFAKHCKGIIPLTNEADLIAMLLVAWAASFGVDEHGFPETENHLDAVAHSDQVAGSSSAYYIQNSKDTLPDNRRRQRKSRCKEFVREVLELVDYYGVLRRPTWDGVRVLLLALPLMEESQELERLAISNSALCQIQTLCAMSPSNASDFEDAAIRARLFWYAYSQEGITIGLRGGRFVLNGGDLDTFQRTLPEGNDGMLSYPLSDKGAHHILVPGETWVGAQDSQKAYTDLAHSSFTPLNLSTICRRIYDVLSGPEATRRMEDHGLIDAHGMRDIWNNLDRVWQDLENKKQAPTDPDNVLAHVQLNQYICAWQIFIFECHNVIRETLKQFIRTPTAQAYTVSPPQPSSPSSNSSPYLTPQHLHVDANKKCLELLPLVIRILRVYTPKEHLDIPDIFLWDTGMVRDGCFYAGYLAASMEGEYLDFPAEEIRVEDVSSQLTVDEGVSICLTALATMRWGFSKAEERAETIEMLWENRKLRRQGHAQYLPPLYDIATLLDADTLYDTDTHSSMPITDSKLHIIMASESSQEQKPRLTPDLLSGDRPMHPPLNLFAAQRRIDLLPSPRSAKRPRLDSTQKFEHLSPALSAANAEYDTKL